MLIDTILTEDDLNYFHAISIPFAFLMISVSFLCSSIITQNINKKLVRKMHYRKKSVILNRQDYAIIFQNKNAL